MMRLFRNKWILWGFGVVIGAIAGYIYHIGWGCHSGSCAITSDPTSSAVYGSFMGVLLIDGFRKKPKSGKQ